jgi:hypothetical protein
VYLANTADGFSNLVINYLLFNSFINSSIALQSFVGPWPLLQFPNVFYTDGRTPWTGDQPVVRPLPTHRTTQTQNKRTHRHPCLEWSYYLSISLSTIYLSIYLSVCLSVCLSMALHPFVRPWPFFNFLDRFTRPPLVVRVPGYRSRGSGFDSWNY